MRTPTPSGITIQEIGSNNKERWSERIVNIKSCHAPAWLSLQLTDTCPFLAQETIALKGHEISAITWTWMSTEQRFVTCNKKSSCTRHILQRVSNAISAYNAKSNIQNRRLCTRPSAIIIFSNPLAPHRKLLYQPLQIGKLIRLGHEAFHSGTRGSRDCLVRNVSADCQYGGNWE